MQKNIILTNLKDTSFSDIYKGLQLNTYECNLVADKETENRYRIERSDTNKVLANHRAVSKKFKVLPNNKILELGNALLSTNENLVITSASSKNYGEHIFLTAKIKDYVNTDYESIKGIGQVEPNIYIDIPVLGNINLITSAYQVQCQNQVIALSSNPLTKALTIKKDEDAIDSALLNFANIEQEFNNILNQLAIFKEFAITDEDYTNYLSTLYPVQNIEEDRPKLYKVLKDKYLNAPNSDPGTLLGAYNSITNHIATNNYKSNDLKYFSSLPTSANYNLAKKAYTICSNVIKVDNVNLLL